MSETGVGAIGATRISRLRDRLAHRDPAAPGRGRTLLLYGILVFLIVVDYTILLQAFVLVVAASGSAHGSVAAAMAVIVAAISLSVVVLPHFAAGGLQSRALGLEERHLSWVPWASIALWTLIVLAVTFLRLIAANTVLDTREDNRVGAEQAAADPGINWAGFVDVTNSEVLLSYFMLVLLVVSGLVAFVVAATTHHPLRERLARSRLRVEVLTRELVEREAEHGIAVKAQGIVAHTDARDKERYDAAVSMVDARARAFRSEVRAILAASLGSPDATSRLIRELRARYSGVQSPVTEGPVPSSPTADTPRGAR